MRRSSLPLPHNRELWMLGKHKNRLVRRYCGAMLRRSPRRALRQMRGPKFQKGNFYLTFCAQQKIMQSVVTGKPLMLFSDFVDGSTINGENNKGSYATAIGMNLGAQGDMGTTAGCKWYLGGAEVDNYRALVPAVTTANNSNFNLSALYVQIGSAAVQALTLGTAVRSQIIVNGVSTDVNDIFGNPLLFTPCHQDIVFIDEVHGNNANAGTLALPKQNLIIAWTGSAMTGVFASNTTVSGGVSNGVNAGCMAVLRGGTYAHVDNSGDNVFCSLANITGCSPNVTISGGTKGINCGYLKITAYPGPINGHAPEVPLISGNSSSHGGFKGNTFSRASAGNPYGESGYAKWIAFSNLKVTVNAAQTATDGGPCYIDNGGDNWRVCNNDLSFPTTGNMLSGGVSGDGLNNMIIANHIHDVFTVGSDKTNHAIYLDGGYCFAWGWIVAFNNCENIPGGNFIQQFNQVIDASIDPDVHGHFGIGNNTICFNWCDTSGKYGINLADDTLGATVYNNVVMHTVSYAMRVSTTTGSLAITIVNNDFYDGCTAGTGANSMIENDWNATTGYVDFRNNIVVMGATRGNTTLDFYADNSNDAAWVRASNVYHDPEGHKTSPPTGGTGEIYGDPKFTVNYSDITLQLSSPALGTATSSAHFNPTLDFFLNPQPRAGKLANSIGAAA